jgi:hypothetical protein
MTNELELTRVVVRLREAILQLLNRHPESEPVVNEIALKLDYSDLADELDDSPQRTKQKETARLQRTLANLQERARALVDRHPDDAVAVLNELMMAPPEIAPSVMAGELRSMSSASGRMTATLLKPQGLEDTVPPLKAKTARKRGAGTRPKTKVGRACLANTDSIVLAAQTAISAIEITIENLKAERLNDPDAPSNRAR